MKLQSSFVLYLDFWIFCLNLDVRAQDQVVSDKVNFTATPLLNYPNGDSVVIKYTITNASKIDLKIASTIAIFDLKIILISPSGKRVTPYPYYPFNTGKFRISILKPGDSIPREIDLSNYFPFKEIGKYRCEMTQRVYGSGETPAKHKSELKGSPIDVNCVPFEFNVELPTVAKLRSEIDPMTGKIPGDQLDGISGERWNEKSSESSHHPKKTSDNLKKEFKDDGSRLDAKMIWILAGGTMMGVFIYLLWWRPKRGN